MHPYLPHLLSDIEAACRTEIPEEPVRKISFEEEMEEVEKWLEGEEPDHTFGYYCRLEADNFPPPEQLTKKDMKEVCKAFKHMMFTWNLDISLPKNFPTSFQYSFLIKTLNEKTAIVNSGFMGFDYCTGYAPDCVFKEYCMCLKHYNDFTDDDADNKASENPGDLPY
jgi:hypothetical protein